MRRRDYDGLHSFYIDLSYDSTTLRDLKKDKLFSELHKNDSLSTGNIVTFLLLGIVIIMVGVALFGGKG